MKMQYNLPTELKANPVKVASGLWQRWSCRCPKLEVNLAATPRGTFLEEPHWRRLSVSHPCMIMMNYDHPTCRLAAHLDPPIAWSFNSTESPFKSHVWSHRLPSVTRRLSVCPIQRYIQLQVYKPGQVLFLNSIWAASMQPKSLSESMLSSSYLLHAEVQIAGTCPHLRRKG